MVTTKEKKTTGGGTPKGRKKPERPRSWKIIMYLKDHFDEAGNVKNTRAQREILRDVFNLNAEIIENKIQEALETGKTIVMVSTNKDIIITKMIEVAGAKIGYIPFPGWPPAELKGTKFEMEPA
jgi:hypothetical protein